MKQADSNLAKYIFRRYVFAMIRAIEASREIKCVNNI